MTVINTDRIEKSILLRAPKARVWRALTTPREFGTWFGVKLTDTPFAPGARISGPVTHPGYEHVILELTIERMEPERLLSWRWHPHAVEPGKDYSAEPTTLVVFELSDAPEGTQLTVVESGFDKVPLVRRDEAFRMNESGWAAQLENIDRHVGRTA